MKISYVRVSKYEQEEDISEYYGKDDTSALRQH